MSATRPPTKYVFVTGGVVSALGKGIVAASLGRLLKARGLQVQAQKFDPYLNVDPGTMSPFQHGEVFVTEDGAETDLDIGHYERFIDEHLTRAASHTAGAISDAVLRPHEELAVDIREKIALFADVEQSPVIAAPDVPDVYLVPSRLQAERLDQLVCEKLGLPTEDADLGEWLDLTDRLQRSEEQVE